MNGADWAFMGYQRPGDPHLYFVIGTNDATEMRTHEEMSTSFHREAINEWSIAARRRRVVTISIDCKSYVMAHGPDYATALQTCMAELERQDPARKWHEPPKPEQSILTKLERELGEGE